MQHLYYLPIILAALSFGYRGGLTAALTAVVLYHLANGALLTRPYAEPDIIQIALFVPPTEASLGRIDGGAKGSGNQPPCLCDLLLINCVGQSRVPPQQDFCAQRGEDRGRLVHALPGDVGVGIGAAEKRGSSAKCAGIAKLRSRRPDQSAAKCDQASISRGVSGDELRRETRPL